jgi:hypothetical protein
VIYKFATIGGRKALLHLTQKPLVVVDQTLHSLDYKAFAGASLLRRKARELRLEIG